MATAAASLTSDTSSYPQFQQFVGGMPLAAGGGGSNNDNAAPNAQHLDKQQGLNTDMEMAQASRPLGQNHQQNQNQNKEQTSGILSARPLALDLNQANPSLSMAELEAAEAASTKALIEGVLGPNKDGRVRNPVPSKLKGKTDNKQGNFGVMHMGVSPGKKSEVQGQGRDAAAERDAAARRTSENTASRAKAAQSEKYVPPKKRGLDASLIADPRSRNSPFGGSRDTQRSRPLAPDETKSEQARLLTLLRSINPVTVVDQICKAVAYFGGIPGAPPPEDGIFPESANTRETGALFIGWLAEIFPDLTPRSPEVLKDQAAKKKGRLPKGVKDAGDASEAPNSRNGYGYGPAVSAPSWGLPQSLASVNAPTAAAAAAGPLGDLKFPAPEKSFEQPSPETSLKNQVEDSSSKRRRGRPKGSRNKGKDGQPDSEAANLTDGQNPGQTAAQSPQAQTTAAKGTQPSPALAPMAKPVINSYASSFNTAPAAKPVSNDQAQNNQYSGQQWQASSQASQPGNASIVPPGEELSPEERAVLEAFRQQPSDGVQQIQQAAPPPIVPTKTTSTQAGQKRKRAPAKPKPNPATTPKVPASNLPQTDHPPILPPGREAQVGVGKDTMQWSSVGSAGTAATTANNPTQTLITVPPPKRVRQRKPKAPANTDTPSRNQTASVVNTTPPIPPSTIPDSQATASQQSVQQSVPQSVSQSIPQSIQQTIPQTAPVARPAAEGLEAHYNYFQQQQQQQHSGRSNTPTMPQQQVQQHARQHSQAQSVTPQQSTPQLQQQNLMQHQKSQQGQQGTQQASQREDAQKTTQASSARPSSTGFYNQGIQPTTAAYSQQYPSHQPSQLYGTHTASPQMTNSSSNSYRTNSTHNPMSQPSPQFTQPENNYRTASPHTLGQPSPSFSQTSTNYRNTSAHNLAQHSPAVTQAENSYRTPTSHALAQPSPAYTTSRSHSQSQPSHQSHYNHFSDSSYIDLPTLESLGHSGSTGSTSIGLANNTYGTTGGFGQGIPVGLGNSRTSATSNSLYGSSSGLSNPYDASSNDLLRGVGVSRSTSNTGSGAYGSSSNTGGVSYGASSSRLSNPFDPTSQDDMRDQLLRGYGRR
ncbi:hypothetical protein WAI453_003913 [Rhynchosporium graminicola]|uniref:Uncharacterized protein n=1 Tax=Rhynchosporium graminicola TaxID=2792576 RepID=A0A1E1JYF7_9HELO|nr:uncharacterized protein RCO7_06681 [Rhynchosporium commune]